MVDKSIPCVYVITNKTNNKKYIGSTKNRRHRWGTWINGGQTGDQQSLLVKAIEEEGMDNFIFDVLYEGDEYKEKEIEFIKKYNTTSSKFGYNKQGASNPHYLKYKETIKKVSKRNYWKRQKAVIQSLRDKSCSVCSESEVICLKYYPHDKEIRRTAQREGLDKVTDLIKESKVLCSNCLIKAENDLIEFI